jgi:hypothetical protein
MFLTVVINEALLVGKTLDSGRIGSVCPFVRYIAAVKFSPYSWSLDLHAFTCLFSCILGDDL